MLLALGSPSRAGTPTMAASAVRRLSTAVRRPRMADGGRWQASRDGNVPGPLVLQVQGRRLAVHADVGDPAAWPDHLDGKLEGDRHPDRFDGHVSTQPVSHRADYL